jgi:hypothetical protein
VHLPGFGILGPYARSQGWAPGPIGSWRTGATGWVPFLLHMRMLMMLTPACWSPACRWVLWVSLAIMLGDSVTSLTLLVVTSSRTYLRSRRRCGQPRRRQVHPLLAAHLQCARCTMTWSAQVSSHRHLQHCHYQGRSRVAGR